MIGDALEKLRELPSGSVHCVVTSPPYWGLRDYSKCSCTQSYHSNESTPSDLRLNAGMGGGPTEKSMQPKYPDANCSICHGTGIIEGVAEHQLGLEKTPEEYVQKLVEVFREVKRVLRDDGTLWLVLGDSYAGSGRGMNADGSPGKRTSPGKQETNKGSILDFHDRLVEAGAIGRFWVAPPPGLKQKDLVGIPWMVAFALRSDGWYLRKDIIWHKPNPMPESVNDRCSSSHEHIFHMTKSATYFYNADAIREKYEKPMNRWGGDNLVANGCSKWDDGTGQRTYRDRNMRPNAAGRNCRDVWTMRTQPYPGAHFAKFPEALPERCIKAGCPSDGVVLDPFAGSGTTGWVARSLGRKAILIELNPIYGELIEERSMSNVPDIMGFENAPVGAYGRE